jgi:hypothetical protein
VRRLALGFLAAASPAVLLASFAGGPAAAWTFALLTAAFPVALMALGAASPIRPSAAGPIGSNAARRGHLGGAAWALAALLVLAEGTAAGVLLLGGGGVAGTLAGFPPATVVLLAGVWLLPLPVATLAYAWTFDETGIGPEHLTRLRARLREAAGPPDTHDRRG